MISYLEARAAEFLGEFWEDASKLQMGKSPASGSAIHGVSLLANGCMFYRLPKSLKASQTELKTALLQPTANMLDMVSRIIQPKADFLLGKEKH